MGNVVGAPITSDYLEDEIGPIVSQFSMGNGRFLKTLKAIHDLEGHVIVKIYKKRHNKESLIDYKRALEEIKGNFETLVNLMPYQNFLETDRSGYLIRQYFSNNLYDRLSTRPFLSTIEKKFITFQMLSALIQAFFKGVSHGDIKCENIMVTTTNWIYLADFASYKPTFIPEDNPADFSYYFDTSGRRTCYIAPERFYETNKGEPKGQLTPQMDVFSLGCVIGELFTDGTPLFDFSQMLSYRKGDYNPEPVIRKINDIHIQSLIIHMIQRDPKLRYLPERYVADWAGKAFPKYFSFVHSFIRSLSNLDHDDRIQCIIDKFDELLNIFQNLPKPSQPQPSQPLQQQQQPNQFNIGQQIKQQQQQQQSSGSSSGSNNTIDSGDLQSNITNILWESEKFINECDKLNQQSQLHGKTNLSSSGSGNQTTPIISSKEKSFIDDVKILPTTGMNILKQASLERKPVEQYPVVEGLDLLLSVIYPSLRHCQYPQTKVKCIGDLLVKFAQHLSDECRLQKIIPYIISMISQDQPTLVRVEALRSLSKVIEMIESFPPSDSMIFSQYIFPSLSQITEGSDELVRIAFAEILPNLAMTAKRFLEIAQDQHLSRDQHLDSERKDIQKYKVYDADLSDLQELFFNKVSDLLTKDSCNTVKRVILSDIYRLCLFFGRAKTNDLVLPLITTFLNDKDWQLRSSFFENIVAVCTIVGSGSLESFIYPMTLEALTDEEENVTERAIAALCELTDLGLFRKAILLEILSRSSPLLLHPNDWIRYGTISLISKIATKLSKTDIYCYLKPRIQPYLITDSSSDNIAESNLFQLLIPPISRESFNTIINHVHRNPHQKEMNYNNQGSYRKIKDVVGSSAANVAEQIKQMSVDQIEEIPEDFQFLKQLAIPDMDQIKIIKIFDYIRSKKIFSKLEDMNNDTFVVDTNYQPMSSKRNQTQEKIVRVAKLRNDTPNINSAVSTSTANLGSTIGSTGIGSSTPININNQLPNTNPLSNSLPTSGNNMVNNSSPSNTNLLINSGPSSLPASTAIPSPMPSTTPTASIPTTSSNNTPSSNQQQEIVGIQELSIVNKKFTLNPSAGENVLSVETTNDCYLRAPPSIPDLGGYSEYGVSGAPGQLTTWKPAGILVSHFIEHKDSVNEIQVSSDNLFFASCSNDGTVKIWDCLRMEKGVTNRARQTYNSQEGRITSISICEKSHTIASASDKGSIHIFRVGIGGKQKNGNIKYPGLSTVKNILDCEGNIISVDHFNTNSSSIVTYATSKGGIHGWDLRSQQEAFHLSNQMSLGLIQSFLIDPNRNWLVTATSRGFLTCWDLRFEIPLYSERVTNGRIYKMSPYYGPRFSSDSWIFVASESKDNVVVWDLSSKTTTKIFRRGYIDGDQIQQSQQPSQPSQQPSQQPQPVAQSQGSAIFNPVGGIINQMTSFMINPLTSSSIFGAIGGNNNSQSNLATSSLSEYDFGIDSIKPSQMSSNTSSPVLNRNNSGHFLSNSVILSSNTMTTPSSSSSTSSSLTGTPINNSGNNNVVIGGGTGTAAGTAGSTTTTTIDRKTPSIRAILSPPQCTYLITAGDDKRIKYWDWDNPTTNSYYISPGRDPLPPFTNKVSFKTNGTQIQEELWSSTDQYSSANNPVYSRPSTISSITSSSSSTGATSSSKPKTPTTPTIHHQETILDLKVMEVPQPMLISASADGIIKVWK
ncbi:putative protein serine/threonine kinase [Cavenderia fasciculata]|uniref:non-specific serine/threonine protein kinase n=1 Tax=Cavenderia fasciculata TaxID=261658 RepID=F4PUG5_CACFS|nr:putative protein serine/threonine kinase [Cavenderia fasciculata]EGG21037.1 putative protein serine/threonine kinase [Cavenderia fasciculata]|eukprot:XP_004358887.1 putative protein serine/threonine kinase [Cavenderia fasciculata]